MLIQEHVAIGSKTTMKIGGTARYYGELTEKSDVEMAYKFSKEKNIPLIVLGGGSNTIFADGEVNALVCRMKAQKTDVQGSSVRVEAGASLPSLIFQLSDLDLDLSALTGILGTIGGAVFGNAGQGAGGIWIDSFVKEVTFFHEGSWKTWSKEECDFRYRESKFKEESGIGTPGSGPIIWEVLMEIPKVEKVKIRAEIEKLLQKRIETQPHVKTAGSCFKSLPDGTPAWKLIDAAGLRGTTIGGVQIAEKHANFLLNNGGGTFKDAQEIVHVIKEKVPQINHVEMRFYGEDGEIME